MNSIRIMSIAGPQQCAGKRGGKTGGPEGRITYVSGIEIDCTFRG